MKVEGIECLKCGDKVWSRHAHDFRWCKCGKVAIDGGRQYTKITGDSSDYKQVQLYVKPKRV